MPQFMGLRRVEHDEETEQQIWFSIFFISDVCVVGSNDNFRFDLGLTVLLMLSGTGVCLIKTDTCHISEHRVGAQ